MAPKRCFVISWFRLSFIVVKGVVKIYATAITTIDAGTLPSKGLSPTKKCIYQPYSGKLEWRFLILSTLLSCNLFCVKSNTSSVCVHPYCLSPCDVPPLRSTSCNKNKLSKRQAWLVAEQVGVQ